MSRSVESVKAIAKFRNEYKEIDGISASMWATGSDHIQIFIHKKSDMEEIAKELGVPLWCKAHNKTQDWAFFIYEGNEFGSIVDKEEKADE